MLQIKFCSSKIHRLKPKTLQMYLVIGPLKRSLKLNEVIRIGPKYNGTGVLRRKGRDSRDVCA